MALPAPIDWVRYSVAQELVKRVDSGWEDWKERGNLALACGDAKAAVKHYSSALSIALGPVGGGGLKALLSALQSWPEHSAQAQVGANLDLYTAIVKFLPSPPRTLKFGPVKAVEPNLASCYSALQPRGCAAAAG
jgi:hypothetical protein